MVGTNEASNRFSSVLRYYQRGNQAVQLGYKMRRIAAVMISLLCVTVLAAACSSPTRMASDSTQTLGPPSPTPPPFKAPQPGDTGTQVDPYYKGPKDNKPPSVIITGPTRLKVGEVGTYHASATDPDGDTVTPSWTTLDRSWQHKGTNCVSITVTDSRGYRVLTTYTVYIEPLPVSQEPPDNMFELPPIQRGPGGGLPVLELRSCDTHNQMSGVKQ